jgi:glucokinase
MPQPLTIGLDIGGTKMAFVVANRAGQICDEITLPTLANNPHDVTFDRIAEQLNTYLRAYEQIEGIGIGVPGPVDSDNGIAINAVNMLWQNVRVRDELVKRIIRPVPIYVENDVNVGAIGEQLFGVAQGASNYIYLAIGTGLGGAVMIDNQIMRGTSHSEMEIGHVSLDPINGRECTCGLRGCVEMSISGKGLVDNAEQHVRDFPNTKLSAGTITTHEIIKLAAEGDALAQFVIDEAGVALGIASAWCTNIFNPSKIILGGGLIHAVYHLLNDQLELSLKQRTLTQNYNAVTISLSKLTDAALGASALVWYYKQNKVEL